MTSAAGASSETVELTVRCAFQTSKDVRVVCPLHWTVRHLKEHLHQVCSSHPAVTSQRLIFSGACLTDEMVIKDVMDQRKVVDGPQVLHLVCPLPQSSPELRHRAGNHSTIQGYSPNSSSSQQQNTGSSQTATSYYEWYQRYYGPSASDQIARLQQFSDYYVAYMNHWQQYQNFMMGQMAHSISPLGGSPEQQISVQAAQAVFSRGDQQPAAAIVPNQDNGNVPVAAQVPAEPNVAAAVPGGGRDVLDFVYKVFRVVLLLSAVMLYSSIERFLAVLAIALFIFFIQLRRNHQRQGRVVEFTEPNVNNNNAGEETQEAAEQAPGYVAPTPPSSIQIFFATCYSFITSFFTSLVPDHPLPVDLN
ncbi:hypothetical protein RB195_006377 [Necator americanus]|uniref:Ubiquitin-like domain-containing protein n=1 Tax=Necator americanus TaxID=51031 RepID=A0ABR1BSC8_NECAM